MKIKICGLSSIESVNWAIDAGADWLGFNSFPKSPRYVPIAQMAQLAEVARGRAKIIALTVDADQATLDAIVAVAAPDIIQLHGHESPELVAEIAARYERPVMKVQGISSAEDVARAKAYDAVVDYHLFDAKPPKDATRPGGLGVTFDWALLQGLDLTKPMMLSGGLTPQNVAEAILQTRPFGVDVASGVESAPGVKDKELIERFIAASRQAEDVS